MDSNGCVRPAFRLSQGGASPFRIPGPFQEPLIESRTTGVRLENTKKHASTILGYLVGGFNHLEKYEPVNRKDYPIFHGQ